MTNPRLSAATTWIETRLLVRGAAPELAAQLLAAIDAVDPLRQRKESKMLTIKGLAVDFYSKDYSMEEYVAKIEAFAADVRARVVEEALWKAADAVGHIHATEEREDGARRQRNFTITALHALSPAPVETSSTPEPSTNLSEDINTRLTVVEAWGPLLRAIARRWHGAPFTVDREDRQAMIDAAFPVKAGPVWPDGCKLPGVCKNYSSLRCPSHPYPGCPHATGGA